MKLLLALAFICQSSLMVGNATSPGFIRNVGQNGLAAHPDILYVSSGSGSSFYFTSTSIISIQEKLIDSDQGGDLSDQTMQAIGCRIDMVFQNAASTSYLTTSGTHHERINFYLPDVKAEDRTIHAMDTLIYHGLYPGVDLVVYWKQGGLKYDWHVTDHSSLDQIAVQYIGHEDLSIEQGGINAKHGQFLFRDEPLFIYEKESGREIKGSYDLNDDVVTFRVDIPSDISGTIVIDPVKTWATYMGGSANEVTRRSTPIYTGDGNIVMNGTSQSPNFPITPGAFQAVYSGGAPEGDAVLFLFDSLKVLQWSTYIGGSGNERQSSLDLNSSGEIVLVGSTTSEDLPFISPTYSTFSDGTTCGYIMWLDPTNGEVIRSTSLGHPMLGPEGTITVDSLDNIYITGVTHNPNLPTTPASHQPTYVGGGWSTCSGDLFVAKYDALGYPLAFTYIGGIAGERPGAIKIAPNGNLVTIGQTCQLGGPATTPNAYSPVQQYEYEDFICELTPDLGSVTLTYLGCVGCQLIGDFMFDSQGALYGAALYDYPPSGELQTCDMMGGTFPTDPLRIMKIDLQEGIQWSTFFGGSTSWETADGIELLNDSVMIIVGTTCGDLPITPNALQTVNMGGCQYYSGGEGFIMIMTTDCQLLYSSYVGGSGLDAFYAYSDYKNNKLLVAGITQSPDIPLTANAFQSTHGGLWDIYMEETLIDLLYVLPHTDELCPGSDLGLLAFNYGYISPGPYQIELSDANGSFADPIALGIYADLQNSDTTWIALPTQLDAGEGYIIRVTDLATGQHFLASSYLSIVEPPVGPTIGFAANTLYLSFGTADWFGPSGDSLGHGQYIVPSVTGTYTAIYQGIGCSIPITYFYDVSTAVPSNSAAPSGIHVDQIARVATVYGIEPRSEVVLTNALGMILQRDGAVPNDVVDLDVSGLAAGVYCAVIRSGSETKVHRFILH